MAETFDAMDSYLQDESKIKGWAESIFFPESEEELLACMLSCIENGSQIVIQGGLTGLCGGAVPQGGQIVNLSKMNRILGIRFDQETDSYILRVEPGLLLQDLQQALVRKRFDVSGWNEASKRAAEDFRKSGQDWFFPPDPTETLASLGGMAACNASGAASYEYGAMRDHVQGVRLVTGKGSVSLHRGEKTQGEFLADWGAGFIFDLEKEIKGKNAAGYVLNRTADAIDLFLGSEGTLGVISELEIRLSKKPSNRMGILFFFDETEQAVGFVQWLRGEERNVQKKSMLPDPVAIEYLNQESFLLLQEFKKMKPELSRFDAILNESKQGIYVEYHMQSEEQMISQAEYLFEHAAFFGLQAGTEWCAFDDASLEQIKQLRHAVPECVNLQMDQFKREDMRLRKMGTDFAVPDEKLAACMRMYEQDLEKLGIASVMFGHIGDNHIHVNLLPSRWEEQQESQALIEYWAEMVIEWGGTVTAEHGIGRTKQKAFEKMFSAWDRGRMKAVKSIFDPEDIFNRGVVFRHEKTPE